MDGGQMVDVNHINHIHANATPLSKSSLSSSLGCKRPFILHLATFRLGYMNNNLSNHIINHDSSTNIPKCRLCLDRGYRTDADDCFKLCSVCIDSPPLLYQRYLPCKEIGRGAYSLVYLARDTYERNKEEIVALKIFHKGFEAMAQSEISFMNKLKIADKWNQYGTLKCRGSFIIDNHVCIVMDRMYSLSLPATTTTIISSSQNTFDYKRFLLDLALQIYVFHELLETIHGDIKIDNVLKTSLSPHPERYQIIDYGNSVNIRDIEVYYDSFEIHSLRYQAPEILVGVPPLRYEIDIWALGILMIEQYLGHHPFKNDYSKVQVLAGICRIIGPLPRYLKGGKFCPNDNSNSNSNSNYSDKIEWQDQQYESSDMSQYYKRERTRRLCKLLKCTDWKWLDLLVDMLEPDPRMRININGIIIHPSLRHMLPFIQ